MLVISITKLKNLVQALNKFYKTKIGKFIKIFDKALLSLYIYLLYNRKPIIYTNILCQLYLNINQLIKYLVIINKAKLDYFKCNQRKKSIDHFLFRYLW